MNQAALQQVLEGLVDGEGLRAMLAALSAACEAASRAQLQNPEAMQDWGTLSDQLYQLSNSPRASRVSQVGGEARALAGFLRTLDIAHSVSLPPDIRALVERVEKGGR